MWEFWLWCVIMEITYVDFSLELSTEKYVYFKLFSKKVQTTQNLKNSSFEEVELDRANAQLKALKD